MLQVADYLIARERDAARLAAVLRTLPGRLALDEVLEAEADRAAVEAPAAALAALGKPCPVPLDMKQLFRFQQ